MSFSPGGPTTSLVDKRALGARLGRREIPEVDVDEVLEGGRREPAELLDLDWFVCARASLPWTKALFFRW
jgi:hypothetical protein